MARGPAARAVARDGRTRRRGPGRRRQDSGARAAARSPRRGAAASPGVSRTTGQSAARATSTSSSVGISPSASGACRSRLEPCGSRLLFRWTRSIRPVIARTSSTAVAEVPAGRPGVAGVEHEAGAELADRVPQPGDRVEVAGHGVAAAGGVLDEQRQREAAVLRLVGEGLAPVVDADGGVVLGQHVAAVHDHPEGADRRGRLRVLGEQLAAGDADPVVGRRHVEHVRRVDDDHDVARRAARRRPGRGFGALVALRVGQEDLHAVGVHLRRPGQRPAVVELVVVGQAGADVYADRVSRPRRTTLVRPSNQVYPYRPRHIIVGAA